jgi:cytochrome P450
LMMAGGMDTTTAVLANAALYLFQNPDERRRLIDEPELLPSAIEEFLRFYSPVQALARTVASDTVLHGQQLREGQRLLLSWASANRDETVFDRADEVVLDRKPNRHAAFGLGAHRCLGSHLARLEIRIVLGELLRRAPNYRILSGESERYESIGVVNGWSTMPIRIS